MRPTFTIVQTGACFLVAFVIDGGQQFTRLSRWLTTKDDFRAFHRHEGSRSGFDIGSRHFRRWVRELVYIYGFLKPLNKQEQRSSIGHYLTQHAVKSSSFPISPTLFFSLFLHYVSTDRTVQSSTMSSFKENLNEHSPLLLPRGSVPPAQQPQADDQQAPTSAANPATSASRDKTPSPAPAAPPTPEAALTVNTADQQSQEEDDGTISAPETPGPGRLPKVDSSAPLPWGAPAGLSLRGPNDENLLIFRRALGISDPPAPSKSQTSQHNLRRLEEGGGRSSGEPPDEQRRRRKAATGIYREVQRSRAAKRRQHVVIDALLYGSHFAQVVIGAGLTALGPVAGRHAVLITVLGAVNTVLAGVLGMAKGQGVPERMRKDAAEFRKLQDWIEETEALLAVGVIGRDRKEVGYLVELAFKKYNAARRSEENNEPDRYFHRSIENAPGGEAGERIGGAAANGKGS